MQPTAPMTVPLVLASASRSRQTMLRDAGVSFVIDPADVDENAIKRKLGGIDAATATKTLAMAKAETVSLRHPEALVIGSDQILTCEGRWFDKPSDRAAAKTQLMSLGGRSHVLIAAVMVMRSGKPVWGHVDRARLVMRAFSEAFIDEYLDRIGADAFLSVGAYQVEGLGIQLFETVEGDIFTIMGMPLLPLLKFLRTEKVLPR